MRESVRTLSQSLQSEKRLEKLLVQAFEQLPDERAKQIAKYPWFENKKPWQKEISLMLKNGFKLEVESLVNKDISYVTEEYVPARLADRDFLD